VNTLLLAEMYSILMNIDCGEGGGFSRVCSTGETIKTYLFDPTPYYFNWNSPLIGFYSGFSCHIEA